MIKAFPQVKLESSDIGELSGLLGMTGRLRIQGDPDIGYIFFFISNRCESLHYDGEARRRVW